MQDEDYEDYDFTAEDFAHDVRSIVSGMVQRLTRVANEGGPVDDLLDIMAEANHAVDEAEKHYYPEGRA